MQQTLKTFILLTMVFLGAMAALARAEGIELEQRMRVAPFLMEGLLQVASGDLDGDGLCELVVLGRDYTEPQVLVHVLKADTESGELAQVWQSPNILEERSPAHLAVGAFLTQGRRLILVLTNNRAELYGWEEKQGYRRQAAYTHNIAPGEVTAGDLDGDGRDELIVARVAKTGLKHYYEQLLVYRVEEDELVLLSEGPVLGNIRAVAAGDLDGDGRDEVLAEVGKASADGEIHIYSNEGAKWVRRAEPVTLADGAVYGMTVTRGTEGSFVYTASEQGCLHIFRWTGSGLQAVAEKKVNLSLYSVAPGGFWADHWGLALLYYPNGLWVLAGPANPGIMALEEALAVKTKVDSAEPAQGLVPSEGSMPETGGEDAPLSVGGQAEAVPAGPDNPGVDGPGETVTAPEAVPQK
ncbi:MAG TPA: VCBS repeat-containing protein [Bacillota bacterium]|jgi:hypothetical protein|nr:VCBS repeat-containing protein [Bacillota bacterium]HPT66857.1 VCBS repeat-containing protein [Bacillota bacterium]